MLETDGRVRFPQPAATETFACGMRPRPARCNGKIKESVIFTAAFGSLLPHLRSQNAPDGLDEPIEVKRLGDHTQEAVLSIGIH